MSRRAQAPVPADEAAWHRVRHLVAISEGDALAPFALRPEKSYVFSPDGEAAVSYRIKLRTAVASGDPVGNPNAWEAAIEAFVLRAKERKLRVAVLGAGERARDIWARYHLWGLAVGRDVVVRREHFDVTGRKFRNLRQAISRTHNAGVTVEFWREGDLPVSVVAELRTVMVRSHKQDSRGFSMILGRLFDGQEPEALIAIARAADGPVVAAHRYLWAGKQDLSLDLPIRAKGSPNGVDERLIADVIGWGAEHGVERISLAFAPFPDLFVNRKHLSLPGKVAYRAVHLLDPLISVERLYRYLRKFHAFDQQRFVMLRRRQIIRVAIALLLLEFGG